MGTKTKTAMRDGATFDANGVTYIPSDCQIELKRSPPSPLAQRYMRLVDRQARSTQRKQARDKSRGAP